MSEMIERVARALAKEEGYAYDPLPYDARARTAIEAMRPRDEDTIPPGMHLGMTPRQFIDCWIDEALR